VAGDEKPLTNFTFGAAHVRFVNAPEHIPDAAAMITLKKKLVTIDSTIVVACIGLLGTIASSVIAYSSGKSSNTIQPSVTVKHPICAGDNRMTITTSQQLKNDPLAANKAKDICMAIKNVPGSYNGPDSNGGISFYSGQSVDNHDVWCHCKLADGK
jgi:hypothetical protein